jgi:hypothetical protein
MFSVERNQLSDGAEFAFHSIHLVLGLILCFGGIHVFKLVMLSATISFCVGLFVVNIGSGAVSFIPLMSVVMMAAVISYLLLKRIRIAIAGIGIFIGWLLVYTFSFGENSILISLLMAIVALVLGTAAFLEPEAMIVGSTAVWGSGLFTIGFRHFIEVYILGNKEAMHLIGIGSGNILVVNSIIIFVLAVAGIIIQVITSNGNEFKQLPQSQQEDEARDTEGYMIIPQQPQDLSVRFV